RSARPTDIAAKRGPVGRSPADLVAFAGPWRRERNKIFRGPRRVAPVCCGSDVVLGLPPGVIEMLARYRGLQADRGWDWGDDRIEMFRWARFAALGDVFAAYGDTGDWLQAVRDVVGTDPPSGI